MRSLLLTILLSGVVLLGVASCATISKASLAPGEVRLISMNVVGAGLAAYTSFAVNIFYEASGNLEIKRACFYESSRKQYCSEVSDASYFTLGTKRAFQVWLPGISPGSHRVECYAEYIRDGEIRRTNVVFAQIIAVEREWGDPRNEYQVTFSGDADAQKARDFLSTVGWDPATIPTQNDVTLFIMNNIADPSDPILNPWTWRSKSPEGRVKLTLPLFI